MPTREQLERKTLRAPFDGVIAETRVDPGRGGRGRHARSRRSCTWEPWRCTIGVPGYQVGRVSGRAPRSVVSVPALAG